ncbi:MAG: carbon monoxide dehydrogenase [Roseburia sp.]|nr:carbon monoxide dehydrogenase [Roseburia sp.]
MFDGILAELYRLLDCCEGQRIKKDVDSDSFRWPLAKQQLVLKGEGAIELGGGGMPAVSGVLYRGLPDFTKGGGDTFAPSELERRAPGAEGIKTVELYGPDLPELKGDVPYARVTLVTLRGEFTAEEHKLYQLLRSIEYIRYHVEPEGYMPRISTAQSREQVRVSKEALKKGLNFFKVGRLYEEAYLRHPAVEAAETVFITTEQFAYAGLQALLDREEAFIMSLEHPLNRLKMDCSVCGLKPVCDELEAHGFG